MTRIAFAPTRIVAPIGFIWPKRRCGHLLLDERHVVAVELGAGEPASPEQRAALDLEVVIVGAEDAQRLRWMPSYSMRWKICTQSPA